MLASKFRLGRTSGDLRGTTTARAGTAGSAPTGNGGSPDELHDLPATRERTTVKIEAGKNWVASLAEVWRYRHTLHLLVLRDLKIRYRQTFLGASWAVLQPLAMMGVLALFMGRLLHIPSDGVPYPVFVYAALVPWTLFAGTLVAAADSLVRDLGLVSKVYFPRLIMPFAAGGALVVDFVIALGLLVVLMVLYSTYPDPVNLVWLPLFAVLALGLALGMGTWLAALNVLYRDVRAFVPFLVQILLFASPVSYSSSVVPGAWRTVYGLNPIAGVVEGFRWVLLGTPAPSPAMLAASSAIVVGIFATGLAYFRHMDRIFADVV